MSVQRDSSAPAVVMGAPVGPEVVAVLMVTKATCVKRRRLNV